jgi:hypothetical protein
MKFNFWHDVDLKGKEVCLVMVGSHTVHPGTIVGTADSCTWLILGDK